MTCRSFLVSGLFLCALCIQGHDEAEGQDRAFASCGSFPLRWQGRRNVADIEMCTSPHARPWAGHWGAEESEAWPLLTERPHLGSLLVASDPLSSSR